MAGAVRPVPGHAVSSNPLILPAAGKNLTVIASLRPAFCTAQDLPLVVKSRLRRPGSNSR